MVSLGAQTASHIIKDVLPGPYPKTSEERAAAAKKYNMQVEDYEPWLMMAWGMAIISSQQERDPWCVWDHPDLRLNQVTGTWTCTSGTVCTCPPGLLLGILCVSSSSWPPCGSCFGWGRITPPTSPGMEPKQHPYTSLHLEGVHDPTKEPELVVHYEIWGGFVHPK